MSSGERKRRMAKPCARDTLRGLRMGCRGSVRPVAGAAGRSYKTACRPNRLGSLAAVGDGPVGEGMPSPCRVSRVARVSWNPV